MVEQPICDGWCCQLTFVLAFNPSLSEYSRQKYKNKLTKFEEHCQLTTYLGGNMDEQYRLAQDRPIDFDFKMGQFLSLKGQQPHVR